MTEKLNGKTLGWFHRNQRIQQLNLLIHICNVYGVKSDIKQVYIDELNRLKE